jgi:hypothetical protein
MKYLKFAALASISIILLMSCKSNTKDFKINDERDFNAPVLQLREQYNLDEMLLADLIFGNKDSVYCVNSNKMFTGDAKAGDQIPVYLFTQKGKETKYFKLPTLNDPRASKILSCDMNSKYIFMKYYTCLCVYDRFTLELVKQIEYREALDVVKVVNGRIFFFNSGFGISAGYDNPILCEIDPVTFQPKMIWKFDAPKGANMTYRQPKKVFGVWNKGIFCSDISNYHIRFYDFNKNLISELSYFPNNWMRNDTSAAKIDEYKDFNQFRADIVKLEQISFIESIDFVNDSTFILQRSNTIRKRFVDIWQYKNNKWNILDSNIKVTAEKTDKVNGNYSTDWLSFGVLSNYYLWNHSLMTTDLINDPIIKNGTYKDVWNKNDSLSLDGGLKSSLLIYKYNGAR